eukprot:3644930-Pleurochrysis_carterae.AAC.3
MEAEHLPGPPQATMTKLDIDFKVSHSEHAEGIEQDQAETNCCHVGRYAIASLGSSQLAPPI